MARKLFFSFHYERDSWRAGQVRNCNQIAAEDEIGFIDAVDWESIKKQGDDAVRRWIAQQLEGTSVTVVLIGSETSERDWVLHEIAESWNRGNGLLGVYIHNVKDVESKTDTKGKNPFDRFELSNGKLLSAVCKTYDWVLDDGRVNLGLWAEEAAKIRAAHSDKIKLTRATSGAADAAAAVGAVALGALAAAILTKKAPAPAANSQSFTPRAPWCELDDKR